MKTLFSLHDTATAAANTFRTFKDGLPELVPTGIRAVDESIGGLGPGSNGIVGASNGMGKSSVALDACLRLQQMGVKPGYISCEDTEDVFGCRLMARYSGVDSRLIRRKCMSPDQEKAVAKGYQALEEDAALPASMAISYQVGSRLEEIQDGMTAMVEAGCKVIWMDYIQKVRDKGMDRRNDVSYTFTSLHRQAHRLGVPIIFLSQISRQIDPARCPTRYALKESGDLENEARLVCMLWRPDGSNRDHVQLVVDKSTFGGEGEVQDYERGPCGTLFQVGPKEEF